MEANKIKKLSTDHVYSNEKSKECKHFSIRGYVAGKRQKEWKMCTLFPINEDEAQPSLPPLVVPRFKSWSCNLCRGQNEINEIDEATREDTSAEDMELGSTKSYVDNLTTDNEESDQDLLMEVAEIMAMSLPHLENENRGMRNSSRVEKPLAQMIDSHPPTKQAKQMDFDLNIPYCADTEQEMLNGNVGLGEGSTKLPDSDKSYGTTISGRELTGPSNFGDQNMTVSGKEKMHSSSSFIQNRKKLFGWLDLEEEEEEETPPQHRGACETLAPLNDTSERWHGMNRNPADFSSIEPGNPYMMATEDKVEKRVLKKRCASSSNQKRKSKKR